MSVSRPDQMLTTTEELSRWALGKLKASEVDRDFTDTVDDLTLCTGEPQAHGEGTLLRIGADIFWHNQNTIGGGIPANINERVFKWLFSTEIEVERQGLRSVGHEILQHCIDSCSDPEIILALSRIQIQAEPTV